MKKKTYYTIGTTTTAIAALLGSITTYWTTQATYRLPQQRTLRQGRI